MKQKANKPKRDEQKSVIVQGPVCPRPIEQREVIVMGHGSGGKMTRDLIARYFLPAFENPPLMQEDDSAVVQLSGAGRLAISTDGHIVDPIFFPGGDIGRLAVCGTVNDLAMVGAQPQWLTASFILEEGLPISTVERVAQSMRAAAEEAGVMIVAGDTKVAERGKADKIFISTTGIGHIPKGRDVSGTNARPGDVVILSGSLGDHGVAVLAERGGLALETMIKSDLAPLNKLVEAMFAAGSAIHVMRDPTRGGLATSLNEISQQSGVAIALDESSIPVRPAVKAACELLGFDPLYMANEGKLVAIVSPEEVDKILAAMRATEVGAKACRIGEVMEAPAGRVLLRTAIGATRAIYMLAGEMLPRIC